MTRTGLAGLAVLAVLGAGSAAAAPERDAVVRPGRGIGKVTLGMTQAQVRAALGGRGLVAKRRNVGFGQVYVELEWAYGAWNVGFEGRPGSLRAVMVGTTLRRQRTPHGLGLGSRAREILRVYPAATCSDWVGTGTDSSVERWVVVRHANGASTVFGLLSKLHGERAIYTVGEITVRRPARGLAERRGRCPANWRRE